MTIALAQSSVVASKTTSLGTITATLGSTPTAGNLLIATVVALVLSFFYVDFGFTQPIWYGLTNYQHIWYDLTHNGDYLVSLINVVKYTVGVVVSAALATARMTMCGAAARLPAAAAEQCAGEVHANGSLSASPC